MFTCCKRNNQLKSILFIGTYLSDKKGTKSIPEKLKPALADSVMLTLKSTIENKVLRLVDICVAILFTNYQKIHFDVFSGPAFIMTEIGSKLAAWKNKPILLTLRGGKLAEFSLTNGERIKKVFQRAAYIQTPSHFLKEHFEKLGFTIHYLPNGLDLTKFEYKRDEIKPYSLLWVRAFTAIYNPTLAVLTLHQIKKKYPQATLTMIGPDSGMLQEVKSKITELGLTNDVNIIGPVPNHLLYQYYQTHHVYLNTTSYESFGTAIIEAASCGIPIVSSSVGEIPYLWQHGENMMLVNSFDEKDFANMVDPIFENNTLAHKLSVEARKKAETFSWVSIEPAWIKLLESA